jgi:hypothetical protein
VSQGPPAVAINICDFAGTIESRV